MKNKFSISGVTGSVYLETRTPLKDGTFPVKVRVTYKRKRKYYGLGIYLNEADFLVLPNARKHELTQVRQIVEAGLEAIRRVVEDIVRTGFSFEALDKRLGKGNKNSVYAAYEEKIHQLRNDGRVGTAVVYDNSLTSIKGFVKTADLLFSDITPDWLKRYERHMKGKSLTTIGIYLRTLRTLLNDAKRSGIISENQYPFGRGKYEIPTGSRRNIALTLEQVGMIARAPVVSETARKMRDLWLFSYMANGINIKDLICLQWKDIKDGEIVFYRSKTAHTKRERKPICAPILPEMETIIQKWGTPENRYVFGYLMPDCTPEEIRMQAKNLTRLMNKHLKNIATAAGLPHVSTYTARHSYASVLKQSGASITFISESLGHGDLRTTENYLASFNKETRKKENIKLTQYGNN